MEQKKKRHNPPILEEDQAVQAFDRNDDRSSVEEKNESLENKVEVVVEKSDGMLLLEFSQRVQRIFGDVYWSFAGSYIPLKNNVSTYLYDLRKKNKKWFKKDYENYAVIEVDVQEQAVKSDSGQEENKIFCRKGKFNPLKITAYTPESLDKARSLAEEYKRVYGQKVRILQEFPDKLEEKITSEGKVFNRFADMGEEFYKDMNKVKETFKTSPAIKGIGKGLLSGASIPFFGYTAGKRIFNALDSNDFDEDVPHATTGIITGLATVCGTIIWACTQGEKGNYDPLVIIGTTQGLNLAGAYFKSLWNRTKK
ncbi:hypothetical protein HY837_03690 [archaeon]|nr:hypothetical protein [archaeon]